MVDMRNGGDVPGITGQGTRKEAVRVIEEMGDDHFDDLLGQPDDGGRLCHRSLWRSTFRERSPDSAVPNSHGEQLDGCG